MRILGISGSLREHSSNTELLKAAGRLVGARADFVLYDGIGSLPHFNPDVEAADPPDIVHTWRGLAEGADAVLICSPEYAGGIPGSMKNALDWLVGCMAMVEKPTAVLNASPASTHAQASLLIVLRMLSVRLVQDACVTVPLRGKKLDAEGIAATPEFARPLENAIRALLGAVSEGKPKTSSQDPAGDEDVSSPRGSR